MEDLFEQITGNGKKTSRRGTRGPRRESKLEGMALEEAMGGSGDGRDYGYGNFQSGVNADSGWLDLDHDIAAERSFGASRKGEYEFDDEAKFEANDDE